MKRCQSCHSTCCTHKSEETRSESGYGYNCEDCNKFICPNCYLWTLKRKKLLCFDCMVKHLSGQTYKTLCKYLRSEDNGIMILEVQLCVVRGMDPVYLPLFVNQRWIDISVKETYIKRCRHIPKEVVHA